MDLKIIMLREISQTEKGEKSHDTTYMWDVNMKAINKQDKQTETDGHGL